jgi:hypothetical protein
MRIDAAVAREAKAMTTKDVIVKAIEGKLSWVQAADILGYTPRHMRRLKRQWERQGYDGIRDQRGQTPRRRRIPLATIRALCELKRRRYPDFSVRHFWEKATEAHGFTLSYTWTRLVLQAAGVVVKAPGRGHYRRKRERRPMTGMLLHLDASTHAWLTDLPMHDLVVMLDDADGRILYARFVSQEGTASTFAALHHVVTRYGRFAELYTDRASHFARTTVAGTPDTEQLGHVSRALTTLGIRQILARSPEARGRSERAFGTIQGRLPQELRLAGIRTYADANRYLDDHFVPDFNRRFTVTPAARETAFVRVPAIDLRLVFSSHHTRHVQNDHTVRFEGRTLQLPRGRTRARPHYVRCVVTVHEFPDATLGISFQGQLLATYSADGELLAPAAARGQAA